MKEQLINFETAKLAYEKGFYMKYGKKYNEYGGFVTTGIRGAVCTTDYPAPTQSLLQKWLREEHKIYVDAPIALYTSQEFTYCVGYRRGSEVTLEMGKTYEYRKYEEALEKGLQEALKLIKI